MLNKKIKTFLFIFLILFCIAAVNADEIDNSAAMENVDIVNVESDSYIATIDAESSNAGSFLELNNTINSNQNDTIVLDKNYTYNSTTDINFVKGIIINKSLTIDGQGHSINGNKVARIFNITNGNLILKNINIINGYTSTYNTGIIDITSEGSLKIINSTFINNDVRDGRVIYSKGALNIMNSTFENNSYLIYNSKDLSLVNSTFINNREIYNAGNMSVINSTFKNNDGSQGGAIYSQGNLTIDNSIFDHNHGLNEGGAIYSKGKLTITNSTFKNNYGGNGNHGYGGAIYSNGTLSVTNCTFENNIMNTDGTNPKGGAIYSIGNLTVTESIFRNNRLIDDELRGPSGRAIYHIGNLTIIKSFLDGNDSSEYIGNGVYSEGDLTIIDSIFNNFIGGAIHNYYAANVTVINSTFNNNIGGDGGAIHISLAKGNTTIINSTFNNNTAIYEGGAIMSSDNMTIINSNFTNNTGMLGSAIAGYCINIANSNFIGNNALVGGALAGSYINGNNLTFINNTGILGSAIAVNNMNISNSIFKDNNATRGGSIFTTGNVILDKIEFINNNATYGGAIYHTIYHDFIMEANRLMYKLSPEEIPEESIEKELQELEEYLSEIGDSMDGTLTVMNSYFKSNQGAFGDDIYAEYNTTVLNNTYTENSYANIYANNTIINCTVISVLDNTTYYITIGKMFKLNATVFADGASVNGYNLTLTDGIEKFEAIYKGYGKYEIIGDAIADFIIKHFSAIINNETVSDRYIVRNGTVITTPKKDVNIEVEIDPAVAGGNITGNITLKDENGEIANITGEVTIEIKGRNYTANVTEGKGTFNIEDEFGPGNYTMNVTFPGNEDYNPAETAKDFTIEDNGIILDVENLTKYYGNDGKLIIILTDSRGNPIADQVITITINGRTYTRTTDSQGRILMSINLIPGIYEAEVSYGNITKNATVTIISTIEAEDLVKYFKNGTQYYAKFYNVDGTPLANANVTFNIHGVFYNRTTDANGIAKLNINLNPGEYIITAYNPVNNESKANVITVLSTIFGENVVKYYRNGTQYYAYVLDENGNPLANANVTFNIHGVFYNRTTDEDGMVKLNINLNPGEYIITAWNLWNGEAKSNNITVYNVVLSKDLEMTTSSRKPFKVTILGEQGEPLANAKVSFNIHGVFYYKTTDANGEVSLDINLIAGKYIITTYYNEYAVSNTIIVK